MKAGRVTVLSPDGIPIRPQTFASREAAAIFLVKWVLRYAQQGYYATADGRRIPVLDLADACTIQGGHDLRQLVREAIALIDESDIPDGAVDAAAHLDDVRDWLTSARAALKEGGGGGSAVARVRRSTTTAPVTRSCAECGELAQTTVCAHCGATEVCRTCGDLYHEGGDGFDDECPTCADKTDVALHPENHDDGDGGA